MFHKMEEEKTSSRKTSAVEVDHDFEVTFAENVSKSSEKKSYGVENAAFTDETSSTYFVSLEKSSHTNSPDSQRNGGNYQRPIIDDSHSEITTTLDARSIHYLTTPPQIRRQITEPCDFVVKKKRSFEVTYESIVWFVFVVTTILCIVDRFVNKGDVVLERKGKRVSKMWGSSFAETTTNVIWALTARLIITSQNLMFYTTLWCFPNLISEYAPRFIKLGGIRDIHIKIHRIAGIFLIGIPSLAHVLVIFLPPLVNKSELTFHPPSEFNYSKQLGHLNWTKFYDPAALEGFSFNDSKGVHLGADELYRLFLMIALFCVIFPLSRSQFLNYRSYSTAVTVHTFAGIWYAIDNIRKITHGLAHVMNLPLLILWCIDRLISIVYYHSSGSQVVRKTRIGDKYIEVRLKLEENFKHAIGDVYYLSYRKTRFGLPSFERSHPFTSFSNHSTDKSWDIGFLMTVMDDGDQWFPAWTRRIVNLEQNSDTLPLQAWGPYRSSSYQLYKSLKENPQEKYILFASGSGIGYLLDTLGVLAYKTTINNLKSQIDIHYTVRDMCVIEQFHGQVIELMHAISQNNPGAEVNFHWYCTDELSDFDFTLTRHEKVAFHKGRLNFEKIVSSANTSTPVYFVGRPSIADSIAKSCTKYGLHLHKDYVNSQRGKSDKGVMIEYLKKTLLVISVAVGICIALSIYIHS